MDWWAWVLIGGAVVILVADWLIVMGANPKRWKGGMKDENHHRK